MDKSPITHAERITFQGMLTLAAQRDPNIDRGAWMNKFEQDPQSAIDLLMGKLPHSVRASLEDDGRGGKRVIAFRGK